MIRDMMILGSALLLLVACAVRVQADLITDGDVQPLTTDYVGAGNGTLDLILFTESAGGSSNIVDGFNGDDACTDMPTGGKGLTASETYITSIGEIRDFYELNFPNIEVNEIVLYVDLNQINGGLDLVLSDLLVVTDYTANFGDARDNPYANDIPSSLQNVTGVSFSGGIVQAELDGPKVLPLVEQGAGWADYAIYLGINPYDPAFSDDTRILFHWESAQHDDGGETVFLSGTYIPEVPEPATACMLALGGAVLARRRRR